MAGETSPFPISASLLGLQTPEMPMAFRPYHVAEPLPVQGGDGFSAAVQSPMVLCPPSSSNQPQPTSDLTNNFLSEQNDSAGKQPALEWDNNAGYAMQSGSDFAESQTFQEQSNLLRDFEGTNFQSDLMATEAEVQQVYPQRLTSHQQIIENKVLFLETLAKFHQDLGTELRLPQIGGKELDLHLLYCEVTAHGGIAQVIKEKKWKDIVSAFSFPTRASYPIYILRKHYTSILHHFEQVYLFGAEGQLAPPSVFLPSPNPVLSSLADDSFTSPPSKDVEPADERKRRKKLVSVRATGADPATTVGNVVTGAIEGKFEHGYFVTMVVGAEKLKGVLYHVPSTMKAQQFAVVPQFVNSMSPSPVLYHPRLDATPYPGKKHRRKREIRKKDPNAPRPSKTGYNFFYIEQRQQLKSLYPDKEKELSKAIGGIWNRLSEEERRPYLESGQRDKERFTKEILEYNEKLKSVISFKIDDDVAPKNGVHVHAETDSKSAPDLDYKSASASYQAFLDTDVDTSGFNLPQKQLNTQFSGQPAAKELMNCEQEDATNAETANFLKLELLVNKGDSSETPKIAFCEHPGIEKNLAQAPNLSYTTATYHASLDRDVDTSGFNLPQEGSFNSQMYGQSASKEFVNYDQEDEMDTQNVDLPKVELLDNLKEVKLEAPLHEHTNYERETAEDTDLNHTTAAVHALLHKDVLTGDLNLPCEKIIDNHLLGQSALPESMNHDQEHATDFPNDANMDSQVHAHADIDENFHHGHNTLSDIMRQSEHAHECDDSIDKANTKQGTDESDTSGAYQFACDFMSPQEICVNRVFDEHIEQEGLNHDQANEIYSILEQNDPENHSSLNEAGAAQNFEHSAADEKVDLTHNILTGISKPTEALDENHDLREHETNVLGPNGIRNSAFSIINGSSISQEQLIQITLSSEPALNETPGNQRELSCVGDDHQKVKHQKYEP